MDKIFHTYLRQVEFVNRNQECILFNQIVLLVENIDKSKETRKLHTF